MIFIRLRFRFFMNDDLSDVVTYSSSMSLVLLIEDSSRVILKDNNMV